jgi:Tol biopolymer transport system component
MNKIVEGIGLLWLPLVALGLPSASAGDAISRVSLGMHHQETNHPSLDTSISADGRFVAFRSTASNLVPHDDNKFADIFVRDRLTRRTVRVSVDSFGNQANDDSFAPAISADGRFVTFQSLASNLVVGDTNQSWDVFVHDMTTEETWRISENGLGAEGNADSLAPAISGDGRYVAFFSFASNLVYEDRNGFSDVFVCDTWFQSLVRISVDNFGHEGSGASEYPSISRDGRFVAFQSSAHELVPDDTNGAIRGPTAGGCGEVSAGAATGPSLQAAISGNGRIVAFQSVATNLVPGDTNDQLDIFVRDLWIGTTLRASVDAQGVESNGKSGQPSLSDDGLWLVFASDASNLVPGDTNDSRDLFLSDLATGGIQRITLGPRGVQANGGSDHPALSLDALHVAFGSVASNLVRDDENGYTDAFVYDVPVPVGSRISNQAYQR